MKKQYIIHEHYHHYTIRRYIRTKFPHLSQNRIHKSIREGDIRINGAKTHIDAILYVNDKVSIWDVLLHDESDFGTHLSQSHEYAFLRDTLVAKRNDLWCFNKPHGLAMQGGTNLKTNMCQLLTGWMDQYDYVETVEDASSRKSDDNTKSVIKDTSASSANTKSVDTNNATVSLSRDNNRQVNVSPLTADNNTNNEYDVSKQDQTVNTIDADHTSAISNSTHLAGENKSKSAINTTANHVTKAHKISTEANHTSNSTSSHSEISQQAHNSSTSARCKPHIVHRLDRNTSGCCIFATNSVSANILSRAFENHLIKKHYVAICEVFADIPTKGRIEFDIDGQSACTDYVVEQIMEYTYDKKLNTYVKADTATHDNASDTIEALDQDTSTDRAKSADTEHDITAMNSDSSQYSDTHTEYNNSVNVTTNDSSQSEEHSSDTVQHAASRTSDNTIKLALISFYPTTGRKHQLRKHITALGCPILGDELYNPGTKYPYMCLHAKSISFAGNKQMSSFHYSAKLPAYMQILLTSR